MAVEYDLIVIGGGVSGLGVALEAARRGYKTLLLEKKKCSQGTSANSLRIIHGGFRYLQSLNIRRVIQSQSDQARLLEWAPAHIAPLACAMPLKPYGLKSRLPVWLAGKLYAGLGSFSGSTRPSPTVSNQLATGKEVPMLSGHAASGALFWEDALVRDPAQFAVFLLEQVRAAGAEVHEGSFVERLEMQAAGGPRVVCREGAGHFEYRARAVVNAAGPWLSRISSDTDSAFSSVRWCKAINLIVKRPCASPHGVGIQGRLGRLFFVLPRGEFTAIGTWYEPFTGDPDDLGATQEELERFIANYNLAISWAQVDALDVIDLDVGVLPMRREAERGPLLYGSEQIVRRGKLIEVLSTKYTTFLSQGRKVVDLVETTIRK